MPEHSLAIISIIWSFVSGLSAVVAVVWNISRMVSEFEKKLDKALADSERRFNIALKESNDKFVQITNDIRAEFSASLKMLEQEQSEKRDTVYRRFDDHKKFVDETFVRNKECGIMHQNTVISFESLRVEVKEMRREIAEMKELVLKQ